VFVPSVAVIPNVKVFGIVSKSFDFAVAAAPAVVNVILPELPIAKKPSVFPEAIVNPVTLTASVAATVPNR
jgi:hypothetical protein